jgi:hypothetical protein
MGQEIIEDQNWLKGFNTEADYVELLLYWDMKAFSLHDVARGKARLKVVRQFSPQNEWEGVYYANTGIGDDKFIWNAQGGFFSFYFYHTLKSFEFGRVVDSAGFVELDYEKPQFSIAPKKPDSKTKLIKVRIDETRFLVPEILLNDFCERAAGLTTQPDDFNYYWIKDEDMEKRRDGLPILPAGYQKFLRYPVETKVISIGKRKIIPNEQSAKEYNFDDIHYPVTLNAGHNKGLKEGMNFFVEDLGEWIQISNVFQKASLGFIRRDFDENGKEECWDSEGGSGQKTECRKIRIGMKAKTKGNL